MASPADPDTFPEAETLVRRAGERGLRIAVAESCTAGLVAELLARIPGASRVLWGSFVAYTVEAKTCMLKIDGDLIARYGAVSRETALLMAEAALALSGADRAVSVTGLAGPEGDGTAVPVGTVWIGLARQDGAAEAHSFSYDLPRNELRRAAAREALELLRRSLD
ncbi:MAG: CinA family protein [Spirochaetaceae bacterium]|jgi:PncC family amidohydrolase|nr:CinA family protein [Spirochaetaceae bacterium]